MKVLWDKDRTKSCLCALPAEKRLILLTVMRARFRYLHFEIVHALELKEMDQLVILKVLNPSSLSIDVHLVSVSHQLTKR